MVSYNTGIPQPRDIPRASQTPIFFNFKLLNDYFNVDHVPFAGIITNIEQTNPCRVISPNHTLITGNQVTFYNLSVATGMWQLNLNTYTITVVDQNRFTLNGVDATAFTSYVSGGNYSSAQLLYGYHKKISLLKPFKDNLNEAGRINIYPKKIVDGTRLFFQSQTGDANAKELTGYTLVTKEEKVGDFDTALHKGIKTPQGIIINFGWTYPKTFPLVNFTFAIPFTTKVYTIIATQVTGVAGTNVAAEITSLTQFKAGSFFSTNEINENSSVYYMAIGK